MTQSGSASPRSVKLILAKDLGSLRDETSGPGYRGGDTRTFSVVGTLLVLNVATSFIMPLGCMLEIEGES